jgi:ABC-2 type transport system permease protein
MGSIKKSFFTISVFTRINVRRYFRDKTAIYFTVAFPLLFLFVFGGIFGKSGADVSFSVALINQSDSSFAATYADQLKASKTFKIKPKVDTLEQAKQKMARSEVDATIVLPPDFGTVKEAGHPTGQAVVYYDQNNDQAARTLATVLNGTFQGINSKYVTTKAPFDVAIVSTNQKSLTQFDYTFAGLVGFSIIGLGIFGPINVFPELKKQGVLRRLRVTPLRVWQYFVSSVLSQSVVGIFSISIMFLVASTVFNLKMRGSYLELAVVVLAGIWTIYGIGLAIGGWAANERQAQPLGNLIVFPMMFLSGTFFPRFLMPVWLQHISSFLPLTPIIDAIRMIITENKHLIDLGPQLGLIFVWAVVIYTIAFRVFRWE